MAAKRIFISDVHMATSQPYHWFQADRDEQRLLGFLSSEVLDRAESIKDLVLLGDIFDNWVFPADIEPAPYSEIFQVNKTVIELLNEIAEAGVTILIGNGNHDFDLTLNEFRAAVPSARHLIANTSTYMTGRLRSEHGHMHTLFNRPDWLRDPAFGRPIGYYMSRLAASLPSENYKNFRSVIAYIDDLLESAFSPQTLFSSIVEALAERAGVDKIKMPGGKEIMIEDLKEKYRSTHVPLGHLLRMVASESDLGSIADRLCRRNGHNVVIFGHTHKATIDKDTWFVDDRIYANCGTWCEDKPAHYVEVEKGTKWTTVTLRKVDGLGKRVGSAQVERIER